MLRTWNNKLSLMFIIGVIFVSTNVHAQLTSPGWTMESAGPISPAEAKVYYDSRVVTMPQMEFLAATFSTAMTSTAPCATTITTEITELARALRNEPKLIYDYVHNHIDYVPYFGSLKGAHLTLVNGSGNDFDQASLMIALLRASGFTANYMFGTMDIPAADVVKWLDVNNNATIVETVLAIGGIPVQVSVLPDGSFTAASINRIWVIVDINGIDYVFDPALKEYVPTTGIDLTVATGYDRTILLNSTTNGATVGSDFVQNLNETGLGNQLTTYTNNMINTLRTQNPNSDIKEIIGGREIIKSNLTNFQTNLPFPVTNTAVWTEIPAQYIATIRIQHAGIDHLIETPVLEGKRLTMTYNGANAAPELRLDGELLATGTATTIGSFYPFTLTIDHPYVAVGGTYVDQTSTYDNISGATYAIISDFGGTNDVLIGKLKERLDQFIDDGAADTSEEVLGETLNMMGMTWMKEVLLMSRMTAELTGMVVVQHHLIGRMAQEEGYYVDVPTAAVSFTSREGIAENANPFFLTMSTMSSTFEHIVLEQMMGSDNPGISTIKLMQIANAQGSKVFFVDSSNFSSIQPQLVNYSAGDIADFQIQVNNGRTLILPADGQLGIGQWQGKGYMTKEIIGLNSSLGMIIGGNYFGGYVANPIPAQPPRIIQYTQTAVSNFFTAVASFFKPSSKDPIDLTTGSFLFDRTDLALGGSSSMGLTFSRSYNSNRTGDTRTMGEGWQHNYDIFLKKVSDGNPGLGLRAPVDAAAMITNLFIATDLMKNEDTIKGWMTMVLAHKWAADQLVDNAININMGGKNSEYIKLPDGTYNPPPGITTQLIENGDGTFSLEERFGTQIDFNANDQIASLTDVDGNILNFIYDGSDQLQTVMDNIGRSLTLNYTGDNITSVTDSEGRTVAYGYDGNNDLISHTDLAGKIWGFGYDAQHQMTTLSNPLGVTTATNVYDALGRVATQTVPRQTGSATYNFYFSGFRNVEEDPFGKETVYYFDEKGRTIALENELGDKNQSVYDGQDHVITSIDQRGNTSQFTYDGNQNLTKITNALLKATNNIYDAQFRLIETIDPLFNTTQFIYDGEHHLIQTTDAELNTTDLTYYPNGQTASTTDGRGVSTVITYDVNNHPETTTTAAHPSVMYNYDAIGRLQSLTDQEGAVTSFNYDDQGLLLSRIDPLSKTASFIYDNANRLTSRTDRNNDVITYGYTDSDKLQSVTYPDLSAVTFTYDLHDQLTDMNDPLGTTTYSRDEIYRITNVNNPYGMNVGYEYDENGNVTKIIYPDSKEVSYTYDVLNRLKTVTDWQGQSATYTYDDAGRLTRLTNFNGTITEYNYDSADRLITLTNKKSISGPIIATYAYTLDGNGNRTKIIQQEPLAPSTGNANNYGYIYNATKNRLLSKGATVFTYDEEGQLATRNGDSFDFDYEHRLTNITGSNPATYKYDGAGNRIEANRNGTITRYVYDLAGNLLAETNSSNTITKYYVHGLGLLAMGLPSNATYTYHFNGIGSTVAITNQSQNVVNSYSYEAFGKLVDKNETVINPFQYVGQYGIMTEANDLLYIRARYYDSDTGRFISEDPTGLDDGPNVYAYVNGNPISYVDPTGEAGILGGIIGGLSGIATDIALQAAMNKVQGRPAFSNFNFKSAAVSGAFGVASGAIGVGVLSEGKKALKSFKEFRRASKALNARKIAVAAGKNRNAKRTLVESIKRKTALQEVGTAVAAGSAIPIAEVFSKSVIFNSSSSGNK